MQTSKIHGNKLHMITLKSYLNAPILFSQSNNIFYNLALETYLYENSIQKHLLFYINQPSVIIGRFQNPWKEINLEYVKANTINVARRYSGGGAVYHDLNNLNISFITQRLDYNRKNNLLFIQDSLKKLGYTNLTLNDKDDILQDSNKISGSAAKLSSKMCYHHCTLLINSDLEKVKNALNSQIIIEQCKATPSRKSSVQNLYPEIDIGKLLHFISKEYSRKYLDKTNLAISNKALVTEINPECFAKDLQQSYSSLSSWDWIYGKTPYFVYQIEHSGHMYDIHVQNGIITEIKPKKGDAIKNVQDQNVKFNIALIPQILNQYDDYLSQRSKTNKISNRS